MRDTTQLACDSRNPCEGIDSRVQYCTAAHDAVLYISMVPYCIAARGAVLYIRVQYCTVAQPLFASRMRINYALLDCNSFPKAAAHHTCV